MIEPRVETTTEQAIRTWDVAIVGAGYVGVPLAQVFAEAGRSVLVVDVLPEVVESLNRGESHIEDAPSETLAPLVRDGRITATADYDAIRGAEAVLIALPTPLSRQREPDLSIVQTAVEKNAKRLRSGHNAAIEVK